MKKSNIMKKIKGYIIEFVALQLFALSITATIQLLLDLANIYFNPIIYIIMFFIVLLVDIAVEMVSNCIGD